MTWSRVQQTACSQPLQQSDPKKNQEDGAMPFIRPRSTENLLRRCHESNKCTLLWLAFAGRHTSNPRQGGLVGGCSCRAGLHTPPGESHGLYSKGCRRAAHPIPTCSSLSVKQTCQLQSFLIVANMVISKQHFDAVHHEAYCCKPDAVQKA